jgi:hypothetical protein
VYQRIHMHRRLSQHLLHGRPQRMFINVPRAWRLHQSRRLPCRNMHYLRLTTPVSRRRRIAPRQEAPRAGELQSPPIPRRGAHRIARAVRISFEPKTSGSWAPRHRGDGTEAFGTLVCR